MINLTPIRVDTNQMVFDEDDLTEIPAIGDWISVAGTSAIPMVPADLHTLLEEMTVARVHQARSEQERLQAAYGRIAGLKANLIHMINNRIQSQPEFIGGNAFGYNRRWR